MKIIFHEKIIFDTNLLQNLPHINIAVRYENLSFRVNLYKMYIIHVIYGLVPFRPSVINDQLKQHEVVENRDPIY